MLTCVRPPEAGDGEADSLAAQLAPDADPGVLQHLEENKLYYYYYYYYYCYYYFYLETVCGDNLTVLGPRDHAPIWKLRNVFSF